MWESSKDIHEAHEGHEKRYRQILRQPLYLSRKHLWRRTMTELLLKDEVYAIIGAAIEVHRELGEGFLEPVYQEALEIEFGGRGIPFESQKPLPISYKGRYLNKQYIADCICYEKVVVELKALDKLGNKEQSQILNYLKATGLQVGLLINFGSTGQLEWKRFVR
jgi:GxxExxY protein